MKKTSPYILSALLAFIIFSCNQANKHKMHISKEYKIDVINKILKDSLIDLKISIKNNTPISNHYSLLEPLNLVVEDEYGELIEEKSLLKYLSIMLREKDTLFIKKQILLNKSMNITSLTDYGFKIVDSKEYLAKKRLDSTHIYSKLAFIDIPIFNKKRDKLYFRIAVNNAGCEFLLKKENENWIVERELGSWNE